MIVRAHFVRGTTTSLTNDRYILLGQAPIKIISYKRRLARLRKRRDSRDKARLPSHLHESLRTTLPFNNMANLRTKRRRGGRAQKKSGGGDDDGDNAHD